MRRVDARVELSQYSCLDVSATVVSVALAVALIVAFVVAAYARRWPWAGFAGTPNEEHGGKTLWDWLQLLIIPLGLAGVAFALNLAESERDQRREDRRAARERSMAANQRREDALAVYVQQMSDLMLERGLLTSEEKTETQKTEIQKADIQKIARTLTLGVLRRLDGRRKGFVVQFLSEARLINAKKPKVIMADADLRGARIRGLLEKVDLARADLREADFRGSSLIEVSFVSADLRRADFRSAGVTDGSFFDADLSHANFSDAGVYDATLARACLIGTHFNRAELTFLDFKAVSGRDVDLSEATLEAVTFNGTLLARVNLAGARLVGGSRRPDPNERLQDPDCELWKSDDGPKAGP